MQVDDEGLMQGRKLCKRREGYASGGADDEGGYLKR